MNPDSREAKSTIGSLERGLDLLEILADRGSVSLADLGETLQISRATAFRILATLQARGYVDHLRKDRVYRLGPGAIALAARSHASAIVHLATPAMAELRNETGETVNLALLRRGRLIYAAIFDGSYAIRMSATVGQDVSLHSTALGKSFLASLPEEQRRSWLGAEPFAEQTEHTSTHWAELEKDLRKIAERGYAVDNEESEIGAACVAAAIRADIQDPVGAISVSGLSARLSRRMRAELGVILKQRCDAISAEIGLGFGQHS